MGMGSGLKAAANATASKLELGDEDIQRIVRALGARDGSFHTADFVLGMVFAVLITALFFSKIKRRIVKRQTESEAIEVLKNLDDDGVRRLFGDADLPSWLNFPDFERVGWINSILNQIWPNINSAVSQQFREILAPLLRQSKPSWIASLKLFRFDLGDKPPLASGVKVYNAGEQSREIMIEVDFHWVGSQDVQLTVRPLPRHLGPLSPAGHILSSIIRLRAGIERITINGKLRLMFKPLLGELPVIGGMQAALVGMPKFSFDVTIYGGDASIVPGLEQWLTQFMKETVFRPYILPERYSVPFTNEAEMDDLRPRGILFLKVIEACNVPKMDLFSQSDVYARVFVRHGLQLRTTIKQDNANPTWNERFKLLIHDPETQELTCVLMDYDDYNPDDEIGRCHLAISELQSEQQKDIWLEVDMDTTKESAAEERSSKGAGIINSLVQAEQKIADQGEKVWKRLPGIKHKNKVCKLHLQVDDRSKFAADDQALLVNTVTHQRRLAEGWVSVQATLYMLDSEDLESAVREDRHPGTGGGQEQLQHDTDAHPSGAGEREALADDTNSISRGESGELQAPLESQNEADNQRISESSNDSAAGQDPADESVARTERRESHDGVRMEALDALKGGVLYVKPRKADSLMRKPWYKGFFLHSRAQLEVTVCGQHKSTASVVGSSPVFSETLEFLLGGHDIEGAEHKRLKIEVWDHRLHINHFRGGCSLVLKEIITEKRIRNTLRLVGVRQGELSLEVVWIPALESAAKKSSQGRPASNAQKKM